MSSMQGIQPGIAVHPYEQETTSHSIPTSQDHQLSGIYKTDTEDSLDVRLEPPKFTSFRMQVAALLLTTFLALCAALDAKLKCLSPENISWVIFDDDGGNGANNGDGGDEEVNYEEEIVNEIKEGCTATFNLVILPIVGIVGVFGMISLFIINRHLARVQSTCDSLIPSHLSALLQLFVPVLFMGGSWTYGIYAIMLRPKLQDADFENPYQSLAAVDKMGHVGANANLYYLSWASEIIIIVVLYQVCVDSFRWWHRGFGPQESTSCRVIVPTASFHDQIHAILTSTSASKLASFYKQRRKTWYQFLIRLRERSAYWVVAFLASLLVLASSAFVYIQVLVSLATEVNNDATVNLRDVCSIVQGTDELPEQYCRRTTFSVLSGGIASILSIIAIIFHVIFRRLNAAHSNQGCGDLEISIHALPIPHPVSSNMNLKFEFLLSLISSVALGLNAVFATGVQGPATDVGNLYYASFVSFFAMLRICLGCLEELYSIEMHTDDGKFGSQIHISGAVSEPIGGLRNRKDSASSVISSHSSIFSDAFAMRERRSRLRRYLFLAMVSAICSASAWDAAVNSGTNNMSWQQKYMVFAPSSVAVISVVLFAMCLKPSTYSIASHFLCGGIISAALFLVWLLDVMITMHSSDSWAVNEIGEIRMANLYYFTWGGIIVSGVQMMSYAEPILGHENKSEMFIIWAANVKVCIVILGASLHVWYGARDTCSAVPDEEDVEIADDSNFCARTKLAIGVAVTGIISGWLATGSRILGCPIIQRVRTRVETFLSIVLIINFGVGVALITGIGGPGQSVGDLYYSSWLAFFVSLGIFIACIDEIQQQEIEEEVAHYKVSQQSDGGYITFQEDDH